jgi:hypothetical protein
MRQPTPGITTYMSYPGDNTPAAAKTATP